MSYEQFKACSNLIKIKVHFTILCKTPSPESVFHWRDTVSGQNLDVEQCVHIRRLRARPTSADALLWIIPPLVVASRRKLCSDLAGCLREGPDRSRGGRHPVRLRPRRRSHSPTGKHRHWLHGFSRKLNYFFSSKSSWIQKTQPNDAFALRRRLVEFLVFNSAFGRHRH